MRSLIVERLKRKNLRRKKKQTDPGVNDAYSRQIAGQRARVVRAERDYDSKLIEDADLARIRETARAEIEHLEA